jgi:hypothetical protein
MIKVYEAIKRRLAAEGPSVPQPTEVELLVEIRDAVTVGDRRSPATGLRTPR